MPLVNQIIALVVSLFLVGVISYFSTLGICMFRVGQNAGSMMYNGTTRKWEIWFGTKNTSTNMEVIVYSGNPYRLLVKLFQLAIQSYRGE